MIGSVYTVFILEMVHQTHCNNFVGVTCEKRKTGAFIKIEGL